MPMVGRLQGTASRHGEAVCLIVFYGTPLLAQDDAKVTSRVVVEFLDTVRGQWL